MSPENSFHIPRYWRGQPIKYQLAGETCRTCHQAIFPPRDICPHCHEAKYEITLPQSGVIFKAESQE